MIIIETFDADGMSCDRRCITDAPIRVEVSEQGAYKVLTKAKFCKICGGAGGVQYFYAQDESVSVRCPICNDGNQKQWDREKQLWDKRSG